MKVENNKVVAFHYTVSENGEAVESSRERGEPLAFLVGHGGLIPGLEAALMGRESGEKFEVSVPPEQAYGERRNDFTQRVPKKYFRDAEHLKPGMLTVLSTREGGQRQVQRVPKKYFRDADRLKAGMQTVLNSEQGQRVVTIAKVGSSVIDVDLNHPLAGRTLKFDIEVLDVRAASEEELAHGHVHGPGGHHH